MMIEVKLCKDCKWAKPASKMPEVDQYKYAKCVRPKQEAYTNPVTGERIVNLYCSVERDTDPFNGMVCSYSAIYFEPKA